jgi:hypothetical protein
MSTRFEQAVWLHDRRQPIDFIEAYLRGELSAFPITAQQLISSLR